MNYEQIKQEVKNGTALVCATCDRYAQGKNSGSPVCTAVDGCGSPIKGDAFHEYQGPLPEEKFPEWCWVCGEASTYIVVVKGRRRKIGVCNMHLILLHEVEPHVPPLLKVVKAL